MTAKEAPRDYIESLTEDDAAELLMMIEGSSSRPYLTDEQIERVRRSLQQLDEGQRIDQGAVEELFGVTG